MKEILADAHCDTIEYMYDNSINIYDNKLSFNLNKVKEYFPYLELMACFVHDKYIGEGYSRLNNLLNYYFKEEEKNSHIIKRILTKPDLDSLKNDDKLGVLLTVENGVAIDGNIDNLYKIYKFGIRAMTITWNYDNQLGCGNLTSNDLGLTSLGKKCIKRMNNLNMIIDVSHSSIKTFWDIVNLSSKPVIASHSNVYKLCKNSRNLTDIQIKEIAKINGIIGITYCNKFLTNNKQANIEDVVKHIEYISNLVGVEHVCLGSDFDGIDNKFLAKKLQDVKGINKIRECMFNRGFNRIEIDNIMGKNLYSFIYENI